MEGGLNLGSLRIGCSVLLNSMGRKKECQGSGERGDSGTKKNASKWEEINMEVEMVPKSGLSKSLGPGENGT